MTTEFDYCFMAKADTPSGVPAFGWSLSANTYSDRTGHPKTAPHPVPVN